MSDVLGNEGHIFMSAVLCNGEHIFMSDVLGNEGHIFMSAVLCKGGHIFMSDVLGNEGHLHVSCFRQWRACIHVSYFISRWMT